MNQRRIPEWYQCRKCRRQFCVMQATPGADPDITMCWECVDDLFRQEETR